MKRSSALLLRIFLVFTLIFAAVLVIQKGLYYTFFALLVAVCITLLEFYYYLKNIFLFYDKTILALLQNDFTSDFSKGNSLANYPHLVQLYNHLKNNQNEIQSKDVLFRSLLNTLQSGVLILQKQDKYWHIFLMNDYFSNHFKIPKVSKWMYLQKYFPAFCLLIEKYDFQNIKTTLQIRMDHEDTQTYLLKTSRTQSFQQEYYVVFIDSIQKVVEKREKEAWINLMKVISHELMNSITPIQSLSQNLHDLTQQDQLSDDDVEDIKHSVTTMLNRSNHLQQFVDSYRKLAMLPSPQKQPTEINTLITESIALMASIFKQEQIEVSHTIDFKRWLALDKNQMEQAIINLLTNCVFALQNQPSKHIKITVTENENRIFITFTDSGKGIEPEIEDKIFLPFFTTRKEGAGIGLTLSKNIIEAHGGYLIHQNQKSQTTFVICLMT